MSPADAAQLLGVATDAPVTEIQHAFTRQARLNHPDLLTEATDEERHSAGIRFAELREARDVLLATSPVVETRFVDVPVPASGTRLPHRPMRNPWSTFLVFLILAIIVVVTVTIQDGFRMETVDNLRGGTIEVPASGP
ncbi:DnaJ domain-containing protein [Naasia aerilata]|uniref:J domain-containing protein n=1 Tax=Naasia aerilata TaxID=1162966 RepID=A0ABM8GFD4_9MICO|nr:DnaJ domain-containing protein [Naasia aerilata]BDZ46804.1 hypothetical protein GCM10025866_27130 [Naasia aerilata]